MKITGLKVTNLRAFKHAEFSFQPGMNLIVGVNGVGKTTVLDALRICLARTIPKFTCFNRPKNTYFRDADFQIGTSFMTISMNFTIYQQKYKYAIHKQKNESEPILEDNQKILTPDQEQFTPDTTPARKLLIRAKKTEPSQPIALFFSTRRSLATYASPSIARSKGGPIAAWSEALKSGKELRLGEIASWMHAQAALAGERPLSDRHLDALREAARKFLPACENLRVVMDPKPSLLIDKERRTLDVKQLSDGERGMLALVLDLAQRLSQANPGLVNPIQEGEAVVLIDELDLHLHPKWQRQIVRQLTETFPNCQFIATTHSPFIIQSLIQGNLINLDDREPKEYADHSIEDIAEYLMGVEIPQKSHHYIEMMNAAEEYFRLLRQNDQTSEAVEIAERKLNELSERYSDDPAFMALLKLEREATMKGKKDATS